MYGQSDMYVCYGIISSEYMYCSTKLYLSMKILSLFKGKLTFVVYLILKLHHQKCGNGTIEPIIGGIRVFIPFPRLFL